MCALKLVQQHANSLPHVVCAVLRGGSLVPALRALLQTDCLEEVCSKRALYLAAMNLLQKLGEPPCSALRKPCQ